MKNICQVIVEACLSCENVTVDLNFGLKVCDLGLYPAFVWGKGACKSFSRKILKQVRKKDYSREIKNE